MNFKTACGPDFTIIDRFTLPMSHFCMINSFQVMPRLIEVTRLSRARSKQREFFLQQLAQLVGIVRTLAKPYMKQILSLMAVGFSHDQYMSILFH